MPSTKTERYKELTDDLDKLSNKYGANQHNTDSKKVVKVAPILKLAGKGVAFALAVGLSFSGFMQLAQTLVQQEKDNGERGKSRDAAMFFINENPDAPEKQMMLELKLSEFHHVNNGVPIQYILNWCQERGNISENELKKQLKMYGTIDVNGIFRSHSKKINLILREYISSQERDIIKYEKYIKYILEYSRTSEKAKEGNNDYSRILYGRYIEGTVNKFDLDNLKSAWDKLSSTRNDLTTDEYLERLKLLVRAYCGELVPGESFGDWLKYLEEKPEEEQQVITLDGSPKYRYTAEMAVQRGDCPLCKKEEITYRITSSDLSVEFISRNLAEEGQFISPSGIIKQIGSRKDFYKYLGNECKVPQGGAEMPLTVFVELPVDEQIENLKNAFINYLASNNKNDKLVDDLAEKWAQENLTPEQKNALWDMFFSNYEDEFNSFALGVIGSTKRKFGLPDTAFNLLKAKLGLYDFGIPQPEFQP